MLLFQIQFGLVTETVTTFSHLSMSLVMKAANSAGAIGIGSAPSARMRSMISGSFRTDTKAALSVAITSGGVPTGATMPNQPFDSKPGRPDSAKVGISGKRAKRLADEIAIVLILPASIADKIG